MSRVLGLDLGSSSIKAIALDATMRGFTVRGYASVARAEGPDRMQTLRDAVSELLAKQALAADQVVVALPGPALATHTLSLPFVDTKRLEAAIPFEIESQLPFDLTEAIFDYQVGSQKGKKSELLLGVVRKEEIRALLDTLAALKIDPRVLTHPGIAYGNLFASAPALFTPTEEPIAIIDIGHERTTVAIGLPGAGVEFARTFAGGGRDLTRALATEFKIPAADAALWKEQHGRLGASVNGPDAERAAGAFLRAFQPVLRELRQSFKAFTSRERRAVSSLYLCGGTARMPGLDEQLGRDLDLPARVLRSNDLGTTAGAQHSEAFQAFALAVGGQATGAKAQHFNLRRGELAFKGQYDYVRERIGRLAIYAASLILLLIASGVVNNSLLSRREKQVDAALCEVTQSVLGKCQKDFNVALNMLKGKESPAAAIPKISAVSLLTEFTTRLPTDVPVTFDQLDITLDRMAVRLQTDSPKSVDRITTALKGYKCFKEVREGKLEKSKDGKSFNLRLDIEVDCPDESHVPQG
jgi:general secretion pathway protein L